MPILFVCEDNGTGISVPTPDDWIRETFSAQPHLRYTLAAGELDEVWDAAVEAVHYVRELTSAGLPAPAAVRLGAMPAATPSMPTAAPRRSPPTRRATRCCATPAV